MKKLVMILSIAGLFTMASCSKSGTCTCGTGASAVSVTYSGSNYDAGKTACISPCTWADK